MTPSIPEGFTRHDGSGCPVAPGTRMVVQYLDGSIDTISDPENLSWEHWAEAADIIAYKPEPATPGTAQGEG